MSIHGATVNWSVDLRIQNRFEYEFQVVNIWPFLITMVISSSLAIPSAYLSLDTIYSKIIGDIDQVGLKHSL